MQPLLQAVQEGLPITVETCAHYLMFASEEVPEGGVQYKCAPPLRSRENRELLIDAVGIGSVAIVSSDHSPAPNATKNLDAGDFLQAWGGISGLQYLLPATNTVAQVCPCLLPMDRCELCRYTGSSRPGVMSPLVGRVVGLPVQTGAYGPWLPLQTVYAINDHQACK